VAAGVSIVASGLALAVIAAVLPSGMIWLLSHADEIGSRIMAMGRRWHLLRPAPVLTHDPPIERIAADLRRLSAAVRPVPPGTPAVRRRGLQMAYDETLAAACRALDVQHSLGELADGVDREVERLRIEAALEEAGLRFRSAMP
jgi:hypothetical protein